MPPWLLILITILVVTLVINPSERDFSWYRTLKRPGWISMQPWIPAAWFLISVSFYFSALSFWLKSGDWFWMGAYAVLLVLLRIDHLVICRLRNLVAGLPFWLLSWLVALILALIVRPTSPLAAWLLVPVLVWTPVEALVTLQMIGLNRKQNRSDRGPHDRRAARSRRL
ncbi:MULTISPECIES: tryptophan-rich sensory protein [unclassified Cyanobium]|uniref:TspO/MBR family protein n=1 Tax=unclassified Cyanobium TaxID=2627006 RepID=UPI0020CE320C|nr:MULTISPECIES: tryptophan-rich sensory protein [unclassified Cyanobium]MCP9835326.1 tryptophan-rich sensory protein [Cyanobium sp. La Preciosa 7G6]MCP9938092.1 tryptophan-rich sensory protein [Cyanobium sp. Aljojuca 7A6]